MTTIDISVRRAEALAQEYTLSVQDRTQPISTKQAIQAIRSIIPDGSLSDKDLATIIASHAVAQGLMVDFDAG
ncbi:hypothetical protein [Mesorhizobium sp. CAU 1741]|uniref:hypothetical protein n=1 Tax=Mesorhizobium sp. CAU 1741 TaxID=3140366 RepID=UPI00325AA47E